MRPIIEFCVNNNHNGAATVMEKLEANLDYDVVEYGCLGNCGECYMKLFAMLDGEIITADSPEDLLQEIETQIQRKAEWLELELD